MGVLFQGKLLQFYSTAEKNGVVGGLFLYGSDLHVHKEVHYGN